MLIVTAHINTLRVHWLVEELQNRGIAEIKVTEYFRPHCQISRVEFICENKAREDIRAIVHQLGTNGNSIDHTIDFKDAGEKVRSIFPLM